MNVQSLSISVPCSKCPNNCKFCVSQMHPSDYPNCFKDFEKQAACEHQYKRRLEFARDNGCNTAIITGDGEPLTNRPHLDRFAKLNWTLNSPFRWIEIQTSGIFLNDQMIKFLRDVVGVSTISLSLSHFNSIPNAQINGTPEKLKVDIKGLCKAIKEAGLNLRISLNLNSHLGTWTPKAMMDKLVELDADQVTFRKLYTSNDDCEQNDWIRNHMFKDKEFEALNMYIQRNGRMLERLPFGALRYSLNGISTVVDDDCMSTEVKDTIKYLILRPNCKLYTKWDDKGSLLF